MLVACRLAGLSALEAYPIYPRLRRTMQGSAWARNARPRVAVAA